MRKWVGESVAALLLTITIFSYTSNAGWAKRVQFRTAVFLTESVSLLKTNLNSELRSGFVGYRNVFREWSLLERKGENRLIRIDGRASLWRTAGGEFWVPSGEKEYILSDMADVARGEVYSSEGRGVRRGDVVIDAGAHVGSFVRFALSKGASKVVAVEPVADNMACLRRNFGTEIEQGRVLPVEAAILDHEGRMRLEQQLHSMDSHLSPEESTSNVGEDVAVTTIDRIVESLGLQRVDFIKMDIEGAERQAILGSSRTILRWTPVLAIGTEHTEDIRSNCRAVLRSVQSITNRYVTSYGRYNCYQWAPCAPMEMFFIAE